MITSERTNFKALLEAKQAELTSALRKRQGIVIERAADSMDEARLSEERELAISYLDQEAHLLRDVHSALTRIDGETYGVCLHCEEVINPKRLSAVPWTPYCIGCQERAERGEFEPLLEDAA